VLQLGKAPPNDLTGLLLACHGNIRTFTALALTLAQRPTLNDAEAGDVAARCLRYFRDGLPLHVEDEDASVWPALLREGVERGAVLERLRAQHDEHHAAIAALVDQLAAVVAAPGDRAARTALLGPANALKDALEPHLLLEEREVFPLLARLPAEIQARLVSELRARRQR